MKLTGTNSSIGLIVLIRQCPFPKDTASNALSRPGGHCEGHTPDPIPNSAVKSLRANDTSSQDAGKSVAARSAKCISPSSFSIITRFPNTHKQPRSPRGCLRATQSQNQSRKSSCAKRSKARTQQARARRPDLAPNRHHQAQQAGEGPDVTAAIHTRRRQQPANGRSPRSEPNEPRSRRRVQRPIQTDCYCDVTVGYGRRRPHKPRAVHGRKLTRGGDGPQGA